MTELTFPQKLAIAMARIARLKCDIADDQATIDTAKQTLNERSARLSEAENEFRHLIDGEINNLTMDEVRSRCTRTPPHTTIDEAP